MLTVLLGGARSGKSTAALRLAEHQTQTVVFVATSPHIPGDVDLADRIAGHRAERPASWVTIEAEVDLVDAVAGADRTSFLIVDCLTVWLGNLMHHGYDDGAIGGASAAALAAVRDRAGHTVVVSNEVGFGIVPADAVSRRYRDLLGRINQQWVADSDRAHLLIAGRALDLVDLVALS
ncbi:MAG: bifunctional adenosylcobinamide kinase/adenosylcobinamide-phosphate guanylyltransferase [Ilumatobacteraceae bacterium]